MNYKIARLDSLDNNTRDEAIRIFIDGFFNIFANITKDKRILHALFSSSFDSTLVYVCLHNNEIGGLMSIGNYNHRSVRIEKEICQKLFGKVKGFMLYKQLGMMMCKINVFAPRECYIDFLTTDDKMRGKGIGAALLEYAFSLPKYDTYFLDVLENNMAAKHLYEKIGFTTVKVSANPIKILGGFGKSALMKKTM